MCRKRWVGYAIASHCPGAGQRKERAVELAALLGLAQSPAEAVAYHGQMVGRQDELKKLVQFFNPILARTNAGELTREDQ